MTISHMPPIGLATAEQIAAMAPSSLNSTGPTPSEELSREVDLLRQRATGATERVAALGRAPGETDAEFRTRMHEGLDPQFLRDCGMGATKRVDAKWRRAAVAVQGFGEAIVMGMAMTPSDSQDPEVLDNLTLDGCRPVPASDECVREHIVAAMAKRPELAGCLVLVLSPHVNIYRDDGSAGETLAMERVRRSNLTGLVEDCHALAEKAAAHARALPPPPCPCCSSFPLLCEYHGEANARGLAAKDECDALVAECGGRSVTSPIGEFVDRMVGALAEASQIPDHVLRGQANNLNIKLTPSCHFEMPEGPALDHHKAMRMRDARPSEMTAAEWIAWCERSDIPDRIRGTSLAASLLRGDYEQAPKGYTFGWDGDGSILVMRVAQGRSQAGNVTHYTHAEWLGASNHSAALAWARTMLHDRREQPPEGYTFERHQWGLAAPLECIFVAHPTRPEPYMYSESAASGWLFDSQHAAALAWAREMLRGEVPS